MAVRDQPAYRRASLEKIVQASHATLKQDFLSALPAPYDGRWGWKDPRTSLTLPYWLEVFPSAQLLHVTRDVEGVAKSLMSRAQAKAQQPAMSNGLRARAERVVNDPQSVVRAIRRRLTKGSQQAFPALSMLNREDCIRLSEIYVEECIRYRESEYNYAEITYEEIIAAPEASIRSIVRMLQVETNEAAIAQATRFISRP